MPYVVLVFFTKKKLKAFSKKKIHHHPPNFAENPNLISDWKNIQKKSGVISFVRKWAKIGHFWAFKPIILPEDEKKNFEFFCWFRKKNRKFDRISLYSRKIVIFVFFVTMTKIPIFDFETLWIGSISFRIQSICYNMTHMVFDGFDHREVWTWPHLACVKTSMIYFFYLHLHKRKCCIDEFTLNAWKVTTKIKKIYQIVPGNIRRIFYPKVNAHLWSWKRAFAVIV